jgi:putative ABC transport system permease protein
MFRATLKSLLARKLRLVLSALAVVLGVSFVAGAFVLTDSLGRTFDRLFTTVNENIAVDVRGTTTYEGSDFDENGGTSRADVPASVLDTVRRVDGVADAQPSLFGNAVLVGSDGKPVTTSGAPTIGTNWVDSTLLNPLRLIDGGNPPRAPNEVVVSKDLADKAKRKVGDEAVVLTNTGPTRVRITGIAEYSNGKGSLGGETLVAFTTGTAQKVFDVPGAYNDVQIAARDGVSEQELRNRVAAALPPRTEAITGTKLADEQASDVKQGLSFLTTFLLVFAAVALFVGAFIIFNTFTILVAQRTKELALMRALGASRGQVTRSVLVESVLVGAIASALGLGVGIGVALGLKAVFSAFGAGLPDGPTVILPRTVLVAFAVGIIVTAVSALVPARRAARVAPVAAIRDAETADRPLKRQTIGGVIVLLLGGTGMFFGLTGHGLPILGAGTLFAFVGVALLSPLVSRPVARLLGAPFTRRIPGQLGRENSMRNPRRTAATAAALMIGLALVSAVGVLGASLKDSVRKVTNAALGAEFVLNTNASGITEQALSEIRQQPGVAEATGLRFGQAKIAGSAEFVIAVPPAAIRSSLSVQQEQGSVQGLGPDTMLVSDKLAKDKGWSVGQRLDVQYRDGTSGRVTIAGTYKVNQLLGDYLLDQSAGAHFKDPLYSAGLVKLAEGADAGQVRQELDAAIKPYPNIELQDRSEFVKDQTDQVNQVVQFFTVLLVLSVLIAVLGIVNTLALSVLERTRELGLLRAVGMSRRQIKRMVRVESVLISVFGGLLGLIVGAVFGVALQRALVNQGVTELAFPFGQLLAYLVVAGIAGVIAAWLPARRASRLNVLNAIAAE